jgi:hypothetical protein
MATLTPRQPRIVNDILNSGIGRFAGGDMQDYFVEAAGQTYKIGDLVYINSSGDVAIATVTSTLLDTAIAGIAVKDATGVTGAVAHIQVIRSIDIVEMTVYHATASSAITAKTQLKGTSFGIIKPSSGAASGVWCVDIENAAESATLKNGFVKIIGFPHGRPGEAIGDIYGRALCIFLPYSIEDDGGTHRRNLQLAN